MVHFKYQVLTVLLASGVVSVLSAPVSGSGSGTVLPPVYDEGRPSTGDTEMTDAIPGSNPRNPGSRGRRPLGPDPLRAGQAMQQGQQQRERNWRIFRSSQVQNKNRPGRQISIENIGRRVISKYSGDLHTLDTAQSIENAAGSLELFQQ
ncbi:hypothetical protein C8R42DRAFT_316077 [Lentinula raphanica]|nr:hypothetical protein C8R42DRAFT_316077 [Lentinula raphanica]